MIKKLSCVGVALSVFVLLAFSISARAQSTKLTLDSEIDTNWPDNTSGAITPAILRSTVKDIVASYVDWLVCSAQGGVVYWNSAAAPTCLLAGTSGQFLKTQGAGANPVWATPLLPAADLTIASNNVVVGNKAGTNQPAQELTLTGLLDIGGAANGSIPNRAAGTWANTATPTLGASGTLGSVTFGNAASGTLTLQPVAGALTPATTAFIPNLSKTLTATIANGNKTLNTTAVASATCSTAQTDTATGTLTTDTVVASFNGDPTAVAGYVPATAGMLTIFTYPTADTANFRVCNNTAATITPGAVTLNWRVVR